MIKIIASDMDGTLLNSNHEISKENLDAIRKAQEKGIHFTISTGRDISGVEPILKKYNLRCQCILSNGAEYRDEDGNMIEKIDIDNRLVKEIVTIMDRHGMQAELFTNKGIYTHLDSKEALKGIAYMTQKFEKIETFEEALIEAEKSDHYKRLNFIDDFNKFIESSIEIGKIFAFHNDVEVVNRVKAEVEKIDGLAVSSSFVDNIEITNIEAQKGLTLAKASEKLGVKREEVMIMGDSFNDYSMFTEFTETVAMENAIPEIKEIAKYITDTNDNHGVAKAIEKVLE